MGSTASALHLENGTEPEPDLAVAEHPIDFYKGVSDHPKTALLIVEVSDSTLQFDRRKATFYANALVPEFWILNIAERTLEVYLLLRGKPIVYSAHRVLSEGYTVAPLARPSETVLVSSFLP